MILKNTPERYGTVAKSFHWLVALCVIGLLAVGLYMVRQDPSPSLFKLYFWHKSIGITVLMLAVLRLVWRLINVQPAMLPQHKRWEKLLAKAVHIILYVALFMMPLSGWVMSSAKGFSVSVFGWFTLPDFVPESKSLADLAVRIHEITAYTLIVALVLHAAGAIKHHVIDKDSTLRRMLPFMRMVVMAACLVIVPATAQAQDAAVPVWVIDHDQSSITFEGTQMGASFTGTFSDFDGVIHFDPDRLDQSHVHVVIRTASADTNSGERDQYITADAWLASESFPESVFRTETIEKKDENQYVAKGELTLRDVKLPITLPFTMRFEEIDGRHQAIMQGETSLQRLDYGVGQGEWKDTSMVGNDVIVRVSMVAHREK